MNDASVAACNEPAARRAGGVDPQRVMSSPIQAVRGMNDVLPADVCLWHHVEDAIRRVTTAYGYEEIRVPVVERTELFHRSIGEQTDIVAKEMYTFVDNNGESLTLRPEATASCVRAGIQHGLFYNRQCRLWYMGPMFRHERPQRGRYRQFHQFGIEAFGWQGPDVDAELMLLSNRLWNVLGIDDVTLELNSLGSPESRERHRHDLVAYLDKRRSELDEDSLRRLEVNPLRILDSKNPAMRDIIAQAPELLAYLDTQSQAHFEGLCGYLDDAGVPYRINPLLVRGLDYYTRTVFEWVTDKLGAQSAVCAGGRYDMLVEMLGGKTVPGAGFALGIERLIELVRLRSQAPTGWHPDVYMVMLGRAAEAAGLRLAEQLRDRGVAVVANCDGGALKRQLRRADRSGARIALVLGEVELSRRVATLKPLRRDVPQRSVAFDEVEQAVAAVLERPA